MKKIIKKIIRNGLRTDYNKELKRAIKLVNILNLLFIFLVIPFLFIVRESISGVLIISIPIWLHLISFILLKYNCHKIGRAIFSITTPTTVFFVASMLYSDAGTGGMAAKFLIIVGVIFPFLAFEAKDWKISISLILIIFFYIFIFDYYNSISVKVNLNQNIDTNVLRNISILTSGLMFISSFYYYRQLLTQYAKETIIQKDNILEKNKDLNKKNETIQEQTNSLQNAYEELNQITETIQAQSDNLQDAYEEINEKNRNITASVRYASTIQTAILQSENLIKPQLNISILFRPKDIVSGDFYWFTHLPAKDEFSEKKFIAAVDCTGHGVPGAFMSMIGMQLLNKIVSEDKIC